MWLTSMSPGLRLAVELLSEDDRRRAFDLYKARCKKLGPERIAIAVFHEHHPLTVLYQGEECLLREIGQEALRGMKDRNEIPEIP